MKRITILLACLLTGAMTACADNDRITNDANELPQPSRNFLNQYFTTAAVSHIKIEKNFWGVKGYDVILTDGSHVEFNRKGEWKEIKTYQSALPSAIVPSFIRAYVTRHYPGMDITTIDKDSKDYEIDLKNGLELKFDLEGKLIDMD